MVDKGIDFTIAQNAQRFFGGTMKTFTPFIFMGFVAMLTGIAEGRDITSYQNLEGLQKVSKTILTDLSLTGSDAVTVDQNRITKIILTGLQRLRIDTDDAKNVNEKVTVTISGVTTGGGGADITVKLSLISRVASPYKKDHMISAIIWSREKQDKQAMTFDAEKKKMVNVNVSVNERIYSAVEELMGLFREDYTKANTK